jgi:chromosome segregation ATPase
MNEIKLGHVFAFALFFFLAGAGIGILATVNRYTANSDRIGGELDEANRRIEQLAETNRVLTQRAAGLAERELKASERERSATEKLQAIARSVSSLVAGHGAGVDEIEKLRVLIEEATNPDYDSGLGVGWYDGG